MAMRAAFLTMHEHLRSFVTMDTVLLLASVVILLLLFFIIILLLLLLLLDYLMIIYSAY